MAGRTTYRNTVTGVVREYPDSLARAFDTLVEVADEPDCITCHPGPTDAAFYVLSAEDSTSEPATAAAIKEA